jgi:flagellar hook assembly protein FlgD
LVTGELQAGYHQAVWDGLDNDGNSVSGGIYLYQIKAGNFTETKKMVFLK